MLTNGREQILHTHKQIDRDITVFVIPLVDRIGEGKIGGALIEVKLMRRPLVFRLNMYWLLNGLRQIGDWCDESSTDRRLVGDLSATGRRPIEPRV